MTEPQELETFDGVRLAYWVLGEGEVVVLAHALMVDSEQNWVQTGIAQAIVDSGRQVVMFDQRGHGRSEAPTTPESYGWESQGRDVVAVLDHLAIERCVLVGYSLGAGGAAWLTPREPRICGAVLAGLATASIEQWTQETVDSYVAQLRTVPSDVEAWVASVQALGQPSEFRLGDITVPVLVLNGEEDFPTDEIGGQIPGAQQQTVPGGHVTAPLSPEFTKALLAFLDNL